MSAWRTAYSGAYPISSQENESEILRRKRKVFCATSPRKQECVSQVGKYPFSSAQSCSGTMGQIISSWSFSK